MTFHPWRFVCIAFCLPLSFTPFQALDNGLALTPPMGYNSWYDVGCEITENLVRETADAFIKLNLRHYGYEYINLDDCWAKGRFDNGTVYADTATFSSPSLSPLVDFVHAKGLKFGLYTDRGRQTCAGRPGSLDYESIDAETYKSWGVDYVKEDSCNASDDAQTAFHEYAKMRDALNATGRPILFSLCGWSEWYAPVGASLGNIWRTGPDDKNWPGILVNIDIIAGNGLEVYAGPGGWNDPCLLLAERLDGHQLVTELQTRAQFSMWAIMASPLMISANIRNMSAANIETYTNELVIAVNQDALAKPGVRVSGTDLAGSGRTDGVNVWARELVDGARALVFLNANDVEMDVTCNATCFKNAGFLENANVTMHDLWNDNTVVEQFMTDGGYTESNLAADGGVAMYKLVTVY